MDRRQRALVLVVGEAPSRTSDPSRPLDRTDLSMLARVSEEEWESLFEKANLLQRWPGPARGKGSGWNPGRARRVADELVDDFGAYRVVVLLGRRVARAFRFAPSRWFRRWRLRTLTGTAHVVLSPHPSRVSRFWNDPRNVARAGRCWRRVGRIARGLAVPQGRWR